MNTPVLPAWSDWHPFLLPYTVYTFMCSKRKHFEPPNLIPIFGPPIIKTRSAITVEFTEQSIKASTKRPEAGIFLRWNDAYQILSEPLIHEDVSKRPGN